MARPLVPNVLWAEIEPLLPPAKPRPKGGRPPVPDRAVLTGILFVLKSGIPWEMLPREMGCGSGMTCWRRLRAWQAAWVGLCASLVYEIRRRPVPRQLERARRRGTARPGLVGRAARSRDHDAPSFPRLHQARGHRGGNGRGLGRLWRYSTRLEQSWFWSW